MQIAEINRQYANLFGLDGEEDEQEGEEQGDSGENDGGPTEVTYSQRFSERWGWIALIDKASEIERVSWDEMINKNVIEFLNVCSYAHDKAELERQQQKEWELKHNIKRYD